MNDTFTNLEEIFEDIEDHTERVRRVVTSIERSAKYASSVNIMEQGKEVRHGLLRIKKTYIFFYDHLLD